MLWNIGDLGLSASGCCLGISSGSLIAMPRQFFLVNLKYGISMFFVISVNYTNTIFKMLIALLTRKNTLHLLSSGPLHTLKPSLTNSAILSLAMKVKASPIGVQRDEQA